MDKGKTYDIDETKFDYEQYKKDIEELNRLTEKILKNNPSCVKSTRLEPDGTTMEYNYADKSTIYKNMPPHHGPSSCGAGGFEKLKEQGFNFNAQTQSWSTDWAKNEQYKREQIKKDPVFHKEIDKSLHLDYFGKEYVGEELMDTIIEKSKEKIVDERIPVVKDLQSLGLYGVYPISDNRFDAHYLDFVMMDEKTVEKISNDLFEPAFSKFDMMTRDVPQMKTLGLKLCSAVGRMTEKNVPIAPDKSIEVSIKDYINDEFVKFVKNLASKNVEESTKNMREPFVAQELTKDLYTKLYSRISMISNHISVKTRRGGATFIYASRDNINLIVDAFNGYWLKDGKTFKYNKKSGGFNYDLIANNDLGNTVIIGRCPKESEIGINLVINKNTLTNFVYSEEDVSGVNLSFDFFAFGRRPEDNYFMFDINR